MADAEPACRFAGLSRAEARSAVREALRRSGIEPAEREARLLLELATGLTPEALFLHEQMPLGDDEAERLTTVLERRCSREPLSRIQGTRAFFGRDFKVTPDVLDPRPDTETLVELVLDWVDAGGGRAAPWRLLDVGTGSGCLLITLLAELPNATGIATDVSPEALDVARGNALHHGVASRAQFVQARTLEGVSGLFDILVSNPPYIPDGALAGLDPEVRHFDPVLALAGGPDGLDIYRELAAGAAAVVPRGLIAVEVGAGQAGAVMALFRNALGEACCGAVERRDLGGHARCVALLTQS